MLTLFFLFENFSTCDSQLVIETRWKKIENFQAASSHRRHQNKEDYPWTIHAERDRKVPQ